MRLADGDKIRSERINHDNHLLNLLGHLMDFWEPMRLEKDQVGDFMLKEGYGSRHMEREEFEWSQFDCHSQLDWDRRVAVGWILLLQIHITTHPICSTPSFYSEEERNIWRCRRMSEWCEEVIAGWKPNRYWQNRLQPADASQRKEMQRRGCGSISSYIIHHHLRDRKDKKLLVHRLICL